MFNRYVITDPDTGRIVGIVNEASVKDMFFKGMLKKVKVNSPRDETLMGFEATCNFVSSNAGITLYVYRGFLMADEDKF